MALRTLTVGIDVGGTFTDLLAFDVRSNAVKLAKVPTTVDNQALGFMAALVAAGANPAIVQAIVHGTTTTTNALLERKIGALDQAAPLAGWQLPEAFATLRRLLEARMGKQGKREFVQVLRLMEVFRADEVAAAVRDAIARGAIGFDAVKHLVLCRIERRPPRLDMTVYPYLPKAHVAMTLAKTYLGLLTGAAS